MKYNVIRIDMNGAINEYDVVPYFVSEWKERPYIYKEGKRTKVKTYEDFVHWFENTGKYQFKARCEYEFIAISWPYLDNTPVEKQNGKKIDVWQQLEMNEESVTKLMWEELKNSGKRSSKEPK